MEERKLNTNNNEMEEAKTADMKSCSACALGVACFADGPIPDFEVAGILGLYGIVG